MICGPPSFLVVVVLGSESGSWAYWGVPVVAGRTVGEGVSVVGGGPVYVGAGLAEVWILVAVGIARAGLFEFLPSLSTLEFQVPWCGLT